MAQAVVRGANGDDAGGGGGGGSMVRAIFDAHALEATLDVIVGAAAPGGDAGSPSAPGTAGNSSEVHGSSSGKVYLKAFGGGGGKQGGTSANDRGGGGGGGGTGAQGAAGGTNSGGQWWRPYVAWSICW